MTGPEKFNRMILRVKNAIEEEGCTTINFLRLSDIAGVKPDPDTAVFQFNHPEVEKGVQETSVKEGFFLPMSVRVKMKKDQVRVEPDRFYMRAGEMENLQEEDVQKLLKKVDDIVNNIVYNAEK